MPVRQAIRQETRGPVLVVTIDRPEARNALDEATITGLCDLFEDLAGLEPPLPRGIGTVSSGGTEDGGTVSSGGTVSDGGTEDGAASPGHRPHAVLLQSSGEVFCAGADLGDMQHLGASDFVTNLEAARAMGAMFRAIHACPAPVVARVQGPAFGGGVGLACSCDVVVASQAARFTFTEVRLGLVPGVIAPLVINRIGPTATRAAFLTAEPIRAVDALRLGLIDRLADQDGLDAAVSRTMTAILSGGPEALGRVKALVDGSVSLGLDRAGDFTAQMIAEARTSGEAQAALLAFMDKQPVPWAAFAAWPPADDSKPSGGDDTA